jgi:transposase
MLELQMHEAKMMRLQGKKIWQIAEALGKCDRMIHYYLSEPTRSRKKRAYDSKLDPYKPYIDTILEEDPTYNREVLFRNLVKQKYEGGVPQEILYDNMKTAFVYSSTEEKWKPNKNLVALASYYGFTPRRCQVRRPQTKGKVERFISFYENNFWIEYKGRSIILEELNETVLRWVENISNRVIGGLNETRTARFAHEKPFLTPLPEKP